MQTVSIIPCLDFKDGRVVKGVRFVELKDAGDPVAQAVHYEADGADELAFLDINATVENRRTRFDSFRAVTRAIRIPITLGGGIRTLADVEDSLAAGAAAVSVSSAAFRDRSFLPEAAKKFGAARLVLAVDVDLNPALPSGREVFIDGGRTATGVDAVAFCREMADGGAGRLLPTSRAADGAKTGYDVELTRRLAEATGLPVIASGGAGALAHFLAAATEGKAEGLLAASVFHFGTFTVRQVKDYLRQNGVAVK